MGVAKVHVRCGVTVRASVGMLGLRMCGGEWGWGWCVRPSASATVLLTTFLLSGFGHFLRPAGSGPGVWRPRRQERAELDRAARRLRGISLEEAGYLVCRGRPFQCVRFQKTDVRDKHVCRRRREEECERLAHLSTSHDVTLLFCNSFLSNYLFLFHHSVTTCVTLVSLPVFVEFPLSYVFV